MNYCQWLSEKTGHKFSLPSEAQWEWTLSKYKPYPYNDSDGRNEPKADGLSKRVVRGGSWYDRPYRATSSYRLFYSDYQKVFNVGFSVVMMED